MTNIITGKDNIDLYRMITLKYALKAEMIGLNRRGRSAYSIIKDEFNIKGSKKKVFELFSNIIKERQIDESKQRTG